jgi:hypothetical protein
MKLEQLQEARAAQTVPTVQSVPAVKKAGDVKIDGKRVGDFKVWDDELELDHKKLTSLEGCPEKVTDDFCCNNNYLTSLEGCPKEVKESFWCYRNRITDLHNIHKYIFSCRYIDLRNNPIKSHVLGLLKIKNLEYVDLDNRKVQAIIVKYVPLGDIFECQSELIEAGFEEYAQL